MLTNGWTGADRMAHAPNSDYIAAKSKINGAPSVDAWSEYKAGHELALATGAVTEEQLRAEFEAGQTANEQKNTASTQETESTAVNDDPATHTAEEMARIEEYKAAVDESLKETIEEYYSDPQKAFSRHNISSVTEKQAKDISSILGGDYSGYKNAINSNGIKHILSEHGPNGSVNHSMSDINDIARIGYVLDNYDNVNQTTYASGDPKYSEEFRDYANKPAPMVTFSKKVNGTYFVVEAVPDTKYKKLWVVSAYLDKKGGVTQAPNAQSPGNTSNTSLASPPQSESTGTVLNLESDSQQVTPETPPRPNASDTSIPTTPENVNGNFGEDAGQSGAGNRRERSNLGVDKGKTRRSQTVETIAEAKITADAPPMFAAERREQLNSYRLVVIIAKKRYPADERIYEQKCQYL